MQRTHTLRLVLLLAGAAFLFGCTSPGPQGPPVDAIQCDTFFNVAGATPQVATRDVLTVDATLREYRSPDGKTEGKQLTTRTDTFIIDYAKRMPGKYYQDGCDWIGVKNDAAQAERNAQHQAQAWQDAVNTANDKSLGNSTGYACTRVTIPSGTFTATGNVCWRDTPA